MRETKFILHRVRRMGWIAVGLCFAGAAWAQVPQYTTADTIALPPDKTDAVVPIVLPAPAAAGATVIPQAIKDDSNQLLSPQPTVTADAPSGAKVTLHFSNLFFAGVATLPVQLAPGNVASYKLQRGPSLSASRVDTARGTAASLWLYNPGTQPLDMRWRIVSGAETICGSDANGAARTNCAAVADLPDLTIQPGRSGRIPVLTPSRWLDPFDDYGRKAQLELHFGSADTAPAMQYAVVIYLHSSKWDFIPTYASRLPAPLIVLGRLIWVTIWVALGAILLMLTQVMIPNFHKCMAMETQVDRLEECLRGISSAVGNRLNTRCTEELHTLRSGLATGLPARIGLWSNTAEVTRLTGILQKVQSRIELTQRLDEAQSASIETDTCMKPPSLRWNLDKKLNAVRKILAGQFVSNTDEKNVSAILDLLTSADGLRKEFEADLETRIAGLRRTFANPDWKTKCLNLIGSLNECAELLKDPPEPDPPNGRTMDELVRRDLGAVKLSFIEQVIILEPLLPPGSPRRQTILNNLASSDAGVLADVCNELSKLAQDVSEQDIEYALANELWDSFLDAPTSVTEQDVVRVSLVFREKRLERSAAKKNFRCFWCIGRREAKPPKGRRKPGGDDDTTYEEGWNTQLIALRGTATLWPEVYSPKGKRIKIRQTDDPEKDKDKPPAKDQKGVFYFDVATQPNITFARLVRGFLDSMITALVPVVTVALTQADSGADMGIGKLVLLGFTSQAIRAAVIPDPLSMATNSPAPATSAPVTPKPSDKPEAPASPVTPPTPPPAKPVG